MKSGDAAHLSGAEVAALSMVLSLGMGLSPGFAPAPVSQPTSGFQAGDHRITLGGL